MAGSTNDEGVWEYSDDGPPSDVRSNLQATALTNLFDTWAKVVRVADTTERAAHLAAFTTIYGAPTADRPCMVWRGDAADGRNLEYTIDGATWYTWLALTGALPGSWLVTPTSVAGTGVTLSGGEVSASAASAISVNGVFDTTYDQYEIDVHIPTSSGTPNIALRLRASGSDDTNSVYDNQYHYFVNTTAAANKHNAHQQWIASVGAKDMHWGTIRLWRPASAVPTLGEIIMNSAPNPFSTNAAGFRCVLLHQNSTAFDGFTLYCDPADTMTGTIRIYGRTKS